MRSLRKKNKLFTLGIASVIAVAGVGTLAACGSSSPSETTSSIAATSTASGEAPAQLSKIPVSFQSSDSFVLVGNQNAATTVKLYIDLQCPYCQQFDTVNSPFLLQQVEAGKVKVEYHLLAFLDSYSVTAASDLVTTAQKAPTTFLSFLLNLYTNQPKEGTGGLSNDQVAAIAKTAGVPDAVIQTFPSQTNADWVNTTTKTEMSGPNAIQGTPTIYINGTQFSDATMYTSASAFTAALTKAIG